MKDATSHHDLAEDPTYKKRCVLVNFSGGEYAFSINDKILAQYYALNSNGLPTSLVLVRPEGIRTYRDGEPVPTDSAGSHGFKAGSLLIRLVQAWRYLRTMDDGRTVFYVRHPSIAELPLIFRLGRRNIVLELNGVYKLEIETISLKGRFNLLIDRVLNRKGFRAAKGVVSVTDEIATMLPLDRYGMTHCAVITNGIDVNSYEVRRPSLKKDTKVKLLAVANFNRWHGYDRMLMAMKGSNPSKVELHLVGDGPEKDNLVRLATELGVRNAIFHPPLKGKELDRLFDECDVALGVLSLGRKGLREMCPLKHREYCARGMPFVYSGNDLDMSMNSSFALRLEEDAEIKLEDVVGFAMVMWNRPAHTAEMRGFARTRLDWSVKMKELAAFIGTID